MAAEKKSDTAEMPEPEPLHAGPEAMGVDAGVFDPNAARRKAENRGPGLQDSEAKNPAVWVDLDSDKAREAAADALELEAKRHYDAAMARAEAMRKGEPSPDNL